METNVFSWTALLAQMVNLALVVLIGYAIYVCLRRKRVNPVKQMSTMDKPIGEVIRERRMRCKLTQEFVAEQLGVSRQAVSKWESGDSHS